MKKYTWKIVLIIAIIAIFISVLIPRENKPDPINLGLDLKGGTYLVMEVNTDDALKVEVDQAMERFRLRAEEEGLAAPRLSRTEGHSFLIESPEGSSLDAYESFAEDLLTEYEVSRSGEAVEVALRSATVSEMESQTVRQAIETIRNRIDELGVTEPIIARQGGLEGRRIVIQLPGVDDPARVKDIIKTTAQLQFRIVEGGPAPTEEDALASLPPTLSRNEVVVLPGDRVNVFGEVQGREYWLLQRQVTVTGADLKTARVQRGQLGEPIVAFSMTAEGSGKFGDLTGANINRRMAIVLDDKVQSAPTINSQITSDGIIEGRFSEQEALDLALVLRSGALPASLTTLEERTVGPTLGLDSIRAGVTAAMIGFVVVVLLMLVYYKLAGVNAAVALTLNLVILLGLMAYFGATLTLPGIAGIILTIAMAVDSNVLVFERIREELDAGKSIRAAIDEGFRLAFGTIIDTNLTTMIAALFLFQFGSGPVRGFAVTLMIGLGASIFTAFFVSRVIFDLIYNRPGTRPTAISI
ncbi:MAG: protein translocase subunit SecD [Acidobacteria bacterium]|nr:protein translocase subunit SecD [Acidobacteriota bacterium]